MRSRAAAVARPRARLAPLLGLGALLCVAVLPAVPVHAVEMKTVNTMDDVEDMWEDFGEEVMKDAAIDMCARRASVGVVRALGYRPDPRVRASYFFFETTVTP
jgi:hypothetical protein